MTASRLDSRSWLVWALAAMTPVMLGRNPWMLVELLVIVLVVRAVWLPATSSQGMGWFLRIAGVMIVVSVVFNVLTVHAGNIVIAELPGWWPVIGGSITLNALVYGVLGGLALFTLVLIGVTVSALISWIDLFHFLPNRLAPIAVTGSVAWAFLPQTAVTWRQIREAQTMRGHRFRAARDFVPIVVPLLAGSLERSLMMAEALESRGFGASTQPSVSDRSGARNLNGGAALIAGLVGIAAGAYCLAVGQIGWSVAALGIGAIAIAAFFGGHRDTGLARTRYRVTKWAPADSMVTVTALISFVATVGWNVSNPDAMAYRVYPDLAVPSAEPLLLLFLGLLMAPALVFNQPGAQL